MKGIPHLFITLFIFTFCQAHAQISGDMQAMHMIKDFYTEYSSLNLKSPDKSKLDALIDKYFTKDEGKILKREYKLGHDIMTSDSGITKNSLETMVIKTINDSRALDIETGKYEIIKGEKNAYEISYVVNPVSPKSNEVTIQNLIVIKLLVEKHYGVYKISYVTDRPTDNLRHPSF